MAKSTEELLGKIVEKLDDLQKSTHSIDKEVALQKAAAAERHNDIKSMQEEQKRTNEILEINTQSLTEHMARTDLLEKAVQTLDRRLTPFEREKIEKEAVAKHRRKVLITMSKVVAGLTALAGLLAVLKPYLLALLAI
jgi:predicted nuclease with TOPRIM domain